MASSNQSARDYVKNARQNLVGRLLNLPLIVEKLHQQNVFNANEVSEIEAEPEKYNKTRKILDWVFNKGEEACYKFLRILDRERKSVLPKSDSSGLTTDLRTWICLFFRDEPEDDYIEGPVSCHQLQKILKTKTKQFLGEQWRKSQQFYGGKVQENFTFIPLVLDTDTETNTPHNKIALKRKKSKKSRSKKMRAYIPRDTQRKSPEDLLNSREKSILIVGKPGIGKTTVVQQMLHHWAERHDPNLDFMFYFDENTLSNISTIVGLEHLLLSKVLMSNPQLKDNVEEFLHYLQEYSEKVTIVFDGIKDFQDNLILLEIMKHDLLPEAKVVATCRPEVEYEFSDWTTCKVYVQGFSEESIYDFFRKMSGNDPEIVDSVINNPALFSLCHVPMYAFMVAACISYYTSEEAKKQCTVSELYIRIFRHCLQRHGKKELLHLDGHIIKCKDKILSLAESAFNATKLKTINLDFYYDETGIAGAFLTTVSAVSPAFAETFCAFHHNTMQEFFSALWLLGKTEILEILHQCKNEDSIHMKYVIPFLCGLQSQTNIPLLKCLFPLNNVKGSTHGFFEKVLKTFFCDQPDDEIVDVAFICQCLYEFKSPEACWSFLERINYHLDLSEEHLDPYACCAVSYVISQSRNKQVHLDLENIAVSLSGLKTILEHSQYLRDLSTTLCQVWTISLKQEQLDYLIQLLHLLGNEIHLLMSTETGVLEKAGKIITQSAEQINLYLHCDNDPHQLTPVLCDTVLLWLPRIRSLQFDSKQGEKEREERCRTFLLDLFLQAALHQPHNILQTVEKMITFTEYGDYYYYYDILSDFLLDLYSRVKQYESETGRRVLPALLPVYQSVPAVWSIKLSERKVSLLLEVLKLQTEKKPVVLRDCSDEESEVRSFLQCLPYISHLSFKEFYYIQGEMEQEKRCRTFLLDLCLQAALHQPHNILQTVEKVITFTEYGDYYYYYDILSDFLLDLYSRVKQYESETGRRVLPALLPVYQSGPAVWSINLSERKVSLLLEVLKLQTEKKPVVLRDCSDEESEVRSFLQCLPYISHLSFKEFYYIQGEKEPEKRCRTFLLDLCLQAALHQPHNILQTVEKVITFTEYGDYYYYYDILSDFLLDLYSRVKQYESETGRRVLPALLPVYQSGPAVWSINLSERKVSLLLEVLKLQTEKKPVVLRDCSDEESEVRSFLQCLPYISHLSFKEFYSDSESTASIQLLLNLSIAAVDCKSDKGESFTELLASVCSYNTFPFGEECHGLQERQSDFLLDLYSRVKQYESETGRRVLPALLPVYQSGPAVWSINLSERKVSLLLEVLKLQKKKKPVDLRHCSDEESEVRSFLQCLPYISHLSFNVFYSDSESTASIQLLLNLSIAAVDCKSDKGESFTELLASVCSYNTFPFDEECHGLQEEQSDFLLDLYSRVKQYESETGRRVLPALLPVYQSGPAVWSINLSERKVSLLLEVLKLQTEKKPVELRDCSDEESEVRSFLQCLPYISHLRFKRFDSDSESTASIQLLLNLSIAAVDCKSDKGESFTELLASVCSYNTFPFGEEFHGFQEEQSDFLLDLYSRVKQYESETGRRVLPALLPVYQSGPAVWYINLSERKVSLLLELLKLQTEKKPVELRDCSDEESEVRSFLQCLPYISHLRFKQCEEEFIPRLSKAVVDCAEDTKLVRAFFAAMDFIFVIDWVLTTRECRAVRKVLRLSDSKVKLTLKPRAISLRGARFLFRHITHLQKLCLSDRVVGRMVRAFGAVRAGGSLVIEELCLRLNSINPKKEIFTFLSSLSSLLNIWTVHCVNLTECRMEAHSLISLMCHPGNLKIRLSKETLQQFTSLLCEVQDGELTRFFLEKVGGDLTSCSLSWEELIYFLQQRVCCISANIRKSKITYNHARQILPLLSEIQFKRLNPSVVLSIIREIYETGSAHCVSSLLSSTHSCINLNNTELDSYHCTALCFTLQHCTSVSLSLLWTSIPEGELVKILPLFNRVSQLSVDRVLLLKLIHCCSISEIQQGAVAAVFSALQSRLDFSCSTGLDLTTETQDNTLHLTTEDCRDISTAIQKSLQHTELILVHCEMEDTGVDMLFLILHSVKLCCSKPLLLRFLARLHVVNESDCVRHAMSLSQALDEEMDLSETPLDLNACRSLALFLEFSEGLSELDLSHCQLTDHSLELLFPHLHKAAVLEFVLFLSLSHNDIGDGLAGRIYTVVSTNRNIQTVRLHNNRITDIEPFRKDKRFEIW
ncbi:uncharacterized protein LOC108272973 isoform X6 [Ictalurus punctatus]|uniref:Uncharacterized protein LOC108272973 isoform X6 n=1 Tax=Ictalurus punctatus TaxID=7998 RepID=A0A9F7R733_ICTPU|nr:uncharacterized protein LOC108272973 isoform X6 [Ictalurus punctatus]